MQQRPLETIVGCGLIACDRAVSIQVIAIDFIGLKTLSHLCELVSLVIAVGACSIDRGHLDDATCGIVYIAKKCSQKVRDYLPSQLPPDSKFAQNSYKEVVLHNYTPNLVRKKNG
jgi:hypothetical protein